MDHGSVVPASSALLGGSGGALDSGGGDGHHACFVAQGAGRSDTQANVGLSSLDCAFVCLARGRQSAGPAAQ